MSRTSTHALACPNEQCGFHGNIALLITPPDLAAKGRTQVAARGVALWGRAVASGSTLRSTTLPLSRKAESFAAEDTAQEIAVAIGCKVLDGILAPSQPKSAFVARRIRQVYGISSPMRVCGTTPLSSANAVRE